MIKKLILEGVQEQFELRKLRDEILDYFAVQNTHAICHNFQYHNYKKQPLRDLYEKGQGLRIWEFKVLESNIDVDNYQILNAFLFNYQPATLGIKFDPHMEKRDAGKYNYRTNTIILNFYSTAFVQLMLEQNEQLDCVTKIKKTLSLIHGKNLLHELQHAYDAFRSKNKYSSDKKSKKYYSTKNTLSKKEKDDLYLILPHEYWARFSETIGYIMFAGKPTFPIYLKVFSENFEGWDLLEDSDKRRLIKALYKYYNLKYRKG